VHEAGDVQKSRASTRVIRIRTDDWPERDRLAIFHEVHGRERIRVEPLPDEPLRIDVTMVKMPQLGLLHGRRSPLRSEFADGSDRLMLNLGGPAFATQFGRELQLERGDAMALSGSDRGVLTTTQTGRIATLEFPQGGLLALLKDPRRHFARRIPKQSSALRLLRGYLRVMFASGSQETTDLSRLATAHICDLAALAVGAAHEAEEIANGRGVRAARLRAIKEDIRARIDTSRPLGDVAARHRLSARYVRMLFESEGTSMTGFVLDERLKRARTILSSPRFARRRIAEIAYAVGFNDVSYFNRTFRRRFGQSPGEIREMRLPEFTTE
jgi:AraC-like DNA-binding protein